MSAPKSFNPDMYPIYIPSRHRPECRTAQLLRRNSINFKIVVEPHDEDDYVWWKKRGHLLVLPKDHQGIGYSRWFIKKHSTKKGESHHWQLDDDIQEFRLRPLGKKSTKLDPRTALQTVEVLMVCYRNIGIAGMNQNSWPPRGVLFYNAIPVQAFLVNNSVQSNYRRVPLMSDFDFILQVLNEGWTSAMFDSIRAVTPGGHKDAGGLKEVYASGKMKDSVQQLLSLWPGLEVKENGVTLLKKKFMRRFSGQVPVPRRSPTHKWDLLGKNYRIQP